MEEIRLSSSRNKDIFLIARWYVDGSLLENVASPIFMRLLVVIYWAQFLSFLDPKDFSSCNLAGAPTHAVLTRSDATEDEIAAYQQLLEAADHHYGHKIYNGAIFSKSAVGLDRVPASAREYDQYLDTGYVNAIAQLAACNTGSVNSREC